MIAFVNLEVRLQLRATVACCSIIIKYQKVFCIHSHCLRRLMRNLLIRTEHFDWLNTFKGIHSVFVTDSSLTWRFSFSHKASQLHRSLYWSLEQLKGGKATKFAISMTIDIAASYFIWNCRVFSEYLEFPDATSLGYPPYGLLLKGALNKDVQGMTHLLAKIRSEIIITTNDMIYAATVTTTEHAVVKIKKGRK